MIKLVRGWKSDVNFFTVKWNASVLKVQWRVKKHSKEQNNRKLEDFAQHSQSYLGQLHDNHGSASDHFQFDWFISWMKVCSMKLTWFVERKEGGWEWILKSWIYIESVMREVTIASPNCIQCLWKENVAFHSFNHAVRAPASRCSDGNTIARMLQKWFRLTHLQCNAETEDGKIGPLTRHCCV